MTGSFRHYIIKVFSFLFSFFLFCFLGLHPCHMEVPRLGVKSELQLSAYTTATATWGEEPRVQPVPQVTATPDPQPIE